MCRICDGTSWEDALAEDATRIAVEGYMLYGVADPDHEPWVYTAGLLDAREHPELIVAGGDVEESARLLNTIAAAVLEGDRLDAGEVCCVGDTFVRLGRVHRVQYALSTFNMWHRLRRADVLHAPALRALQCIVVPDHHAQPLLDRPHARVGETRRRWAS